MTSPWSYPDPVGIQSPSLEQDLILGITDRLKSVIADRRMYARVQVRFDTANGAGSYSERFPEAAENIKQLDKEILELHAKLGDPNLALQEMQEEQQQARAVIPATRDVQPRSKPTKESSGAWIIQVTLGVLAAMTALDGFDDERGKQFVAGSRMFTRLVEQKEQAGPGQQWQGAAARAYTTRDSELHDQFEQMAHTDTRMRQLLYSHAERVTNTRIVMATCSGFLGFPCIPFAVFLEAQGRYAESIVFQIAVCDAALTACGIAQRELLSHSRRTAAGVHDAISDYHRIAAGAGSAAAKLVEVDWTAAKAGQNAVAATDPSTVSAATPTSPSPQPLTPHPATPPATIGADRQAHAGLPPRLTHPAEPQPLRPAKSAPANASAIAGAPGAATAQPDGLSWTVGRAKPHFDNDQTNVPLSPHPARTTAAHPSAAKRSDRTNTTAERNQPTPESPIEAIPAAIINAGDQATHPDPRRPANLE